ncbi:DUF6894 family protein [Bradyrhizobium sp.]|uniref:DUF6894 family protein n=1 Tax=Bradyrhizobium sp. TaxID=376 RepID=UPI003C4ED3CC
MAQIYFHCTSTEGLMIGHCGAAVGDLAEAKDQATLLMRSLIMEPGEEDWRSWVLHASDDLGEEIFALPFAAMLGKPH